MEFFAHPWYMAAGGALVSLPILIHLINRMRFKRIRWAAMEFLLKSQKRNRRRLIIEQLILLMLRILLVLLVAFLVSRFRAEAMGAKQGATHVIILDDTLSMSDRWKDKTQTLTSFEVAKEEIGLLAKSASQAPSTQQMVVYLLSDLDTTIFNQRLNDSAVEELKSILGTKKPTALHFDPILAIQKGVSYFNDVPQGQKILHFISDFRERDWSAGPGVEKLTEAIDKLNGEGVHLSLIDVAAPYRGKARQVALNHDNLALVDLRAETRVAAEGVPVEFTLTIENFSPSDTSTFLTVKVDGQEDFSAAAPIAKVPAFQRYEHKFSLLFAKKKGVQELRDSDSPEERERKRRLEREFVTVTASISAEASGLNADNVRDMVLEVRKKVPTLVVDGNGPESRLPGGDLFHLEVALAAAKSYEVERRKLEELDKTNLDLYPGIIFLNVPEIKDEKILERLDEYVKKGGSIAYFMGDKVKAGFYNDTLFKKYNGLFPLLVGERPYNPIDPNGLMSEEDRAERRRERRQLDEQPKILFRNPTHPVIASLYPNRMVFRFLGIDLYYKAEPRSKWDPEPRQVDEIVVLPNDRSIDDYKGRAQQLAGRALEMTRDLALGDAEYQKYVEPVDVFKREVTTALSTPYLYNLIRVLDVLLTDPGSKDDPAHPNMATLWAQPKMKNLAIDIREFLEQLQYGDPLVVSRRHGKGRAVAILTSAGTSSRWNDWGGGSPASWSYPVFLMDLQRYLTSEGDDFNRIVGEELTFQLDASRYQPKVKRTFMPQMDLDAAGEGPRANAGPKLENHGEQTLPMSKNLLTLNFADARRPGVYTFEFFPLADKEGSTQTEMRSYAFNIDAAAESDLKRATKEKLERSRSAKEARVGGILLRSPGDDYEMYRERQPDASEGGWLYLLFLVVLIVEQALAVHLSFHLRGNEAAAPAPGRTQPAAA
jgi:hypothetical protein